MAEGESKPQLDAVWTGRFYRDNDPRSVNRLVKILSEPDGSNERVIANDGCRNTKISIRRLKSHAYTRCPELEK